MTNFRNLSEAGDASYKLDSNWTDPQTTLDRNRPSSTHAEGYFQVLAAPNVHLVVVGADLLKVRTADGEQAAGHHRRPERRRHVGPSLLSRAKIEKVNKYQNQIADESINRSRLLSERISTVWLLQK